MPVSPRGEEDSDFDARFAAIISPIADSMDWSLDDDESLAREQAAKDAADREAADAQAARRAQRRLERAQELAEYNAEKAAVEAEYNSDDGHFRPPEPPPLPRLRPVTISGVLLVVAGLTLIAFPAVLVVDTQLTLVLGLLLLLGGVGTLISRLRRASDDSDNGAVL